MIIAINGLVRGVNGEQGVAGAGKDEVAKRLCEKHGFVVVSLSDPMKRFVREVYDFSEGQLWGPSEKRNEPDTRYIRGYRLHCGCLADYWNRMNDTSTYWWVRSIVEPCEAHRDGQGWVRGKLFRDPPPEPEYLTPRHALQQLGTEWGRNNYEDTWVRYLLRIYEQLQAGECYYDQVDGIRHMSFVGQDMMKPKINVVVPDVRFSNEQAFLQDAGKTVRVKRDYGVLPGHFGGHLSETELLNLPDKEFDYTLENNSTLRELYDKVDHMMEEINAK